MAKKDISTTKVTRSLDFKLTDADYIAKGKEAAIVAKDLGELERDFDNVKKKWKGKIEAKQLALDATLHTIRMGTEAREVECIEQKDFGANVVSYLYQNKVMFEREMRPDERQQEMKLAPPPAPKPKRDHRKDAAGDKDDQIAEVIRMEKSKNKTDLTV